MKEHYPEVIVINPKETDAVAFVKNNSDHSGADRVLEVAGSPDTFELAWKAARPNAIVTVVALYEEAQRLPLPEMYGSSLLSGPVSADGKGSYTMTCIASDENFGAGAHKLTVRFHGDSNMADYEESVTITIADDGYTSVDKVSPTCEKPGKKTHFTDSQGKFYIEENGVKKEVTEQDLIIPATGHSPGKWIQKDDRHFQEC